MPIAHGIPANVRTAVRVAVAVVDDLSGGAGGRMVADSPLRVPANSAYRSAQQNRSPLLIRPLARCCSPWLKMSWNAAPPFHSTSGWKVVAVSPQEDQKIGKVTPRLGSVVTAPLASAGAPSIAEL